MNNLKIIKYPEEELELIAKWRSDPQIKRYLRPGIQTLSAVQKWKEEYFSGKCNQIFSIKISDDPIGYFTIEGIDYSNLTCEFGIVIGESDIHGKGIGSACIHRMLHKAFTEMSMHRVQATINQDNISSVKCFEKAGFVYEGRHREARCRDEQFKDVLFYSILSDEWEKISNPAVNHDAE